MNRKSLAFMSLIIAGTVAGCTSVGSKLHLTGKDSTSTGDIRIDGSTGHATWTWGPKSFSQDFDVTKNDFVGGIVNGGTIDLKLRDGSPLQIMAEHGAAVCSEGCDSAHMPLLWHVAND